MIRVATNTFSDSLITQLNQIQVNEQQLQNQAATGLRVQNPEDDPAAMRRILDLQAQSASVTQYQQNITQIQQQSTAAYSAMQSLQTIANQASEIATSADGTTSSQDLATYATQVTQLIQQAAQLMNSQFEGSYLFGGTLTNQAPYVVNQNSAGQVTSVDYQGNTTVPSVEIAPGITLAAVPNVGANTSGSGPQGLITDSRSGADFFNHLISLQNDLLAGNTGAISSTDATNLQNDSDNITQQIATTGALQSRMEAETSIAQSQSSALDQLTSSQADADMATVLTQLQSAQLAYQAAAASGANLLNLNLSLVSYLQ